MRHHRRWLFATMLLVAGDRQHKSLSSAEAAAVLDRDVAQLRHDTTTVLGLSAEGAGLDAAYDGVALRRLEAILLDETGRARDRS